MVVEFHFIIKRSAADDAIEPLPEGSTEMNRTSLMLKVERIRISSSAHASTEIVTSANSPADRTVKLHTGHEMLLRDRSVRKEFDGL